jgi:hypothetical protein
MLGAEASLEAMPAAEAAPSLHLPAALVVAFPAEFAVAATLVAAHAAASAVAVAAVVADAVNPRALQDHGPVCFGRRAFSLQLKSTGATIRRSSVLQFTCSKKGEAYEARRISFSFWIVFLAGLRNVDTRTPEPGSGF